eukprot:4440211-Pleurochrysis_carterae.AAC.2
MQARAYACVPACVCARAYACSHICSVHVRVLPVYVRTRARTYRTSRAPEEGGASLACLCLAEMAFISERAVVTEPRITALPRKPKITTKSVKDVCS